MDVSEILRWWILNKNNNTSRFQQQTWSFHPGQHVTSSLWIQRKKHGIITHLDFNQKVEFASKHGDITWLSSNWGSSGQFIDKNSRTADLGANADGLRLTWGTARLVPRCPQYFPSKLLLGAHNSSHEYWQKHHHILCHRTRGCNYCGPKFNNNNSRKRKHNPNWEDVYTYIYIVCVCVSLCISVMSYEYRYIHISLSG